ncbi:MAG: malto-oligosyltrehalose synthase, partial [Acidobacteria bacterium]|nr:malto-oligosyltrehalose synthase [Acidobacteriota bacterium]
MPDDTAVRDTRRPLRVPVSTYRLQLWGAFGFASARTLVSYLARLGITDLYASPIVTARPGSTHGYDICNHNEINLELGGEGEFEALSSELAAEGLGLIVDFVPNHMGIDARLNPWWRDVLENGPSSPYARFFDIDWTPLKAELEGKVLLPILGDQYGRVLERGELRLAFADGAFGLEYLDHRLPINPRQATRVLHYGLAELREELGDEHPHLREFLSIMTALHNIPAASETNPDRTAERQREKEVARERLQRVLEQSPRLQQHIDAAVRAFNGQAGQPQSFDLLHDLLEAQPYRLSYWRTASHEINYRRFFDINDLAGLRMADDQVFVATHGLVRRLLTASKLTGLRIDHPDGLFDPGKYVAMVQALARSAWSEANAAPREALERLAAPLYLVLEKILSTGESLPPEWPVHGTTGYNFLNEVNALFVDYRQARSLRRIYRRLTAADDPFPRIVYESKKLIMETAMASELNVLAFALNRMSERSRRSRDFTLNSLRDVLQEIIACFPVYRTYVSEQGWSDADRRTIEEAIQLARRYNPATESTIYDFVREVLLPRRETDPDLVREGERRHGYPPADEAERLQRWHFAMRFQQSTGPVQAKGLEDTAFYRDNLLLSLNEVGGDPAQFGGSAAAFHQAAARRRAEWPYEMLATSTHDTKLSEDVRARLNALSELPDQWRRDLGRWLRMNAAHRTIVDGEPAPDRNDEYRFYQALVGIWPTESPGPRTSLPRGLVDRLSAFMLKSAHEAKLHTSWISPNLAYDEAVLRYVERTLTGHSAARFLSSFLPLQRRIARIGMINALAQVLLKIASPGVPDFYQGT